MNLFFLKLIFVLQVLAAGWGQQGEKGGGSVTLKYVWLDVISPGECRARIQTAVDTQPGFKGRFTSNTICTWEEAEDTCGGDSGGPLVTRAGDSLELVGLTSWGPRSCANSQVRRKRQMLFPAAGNLFKC